MLFVSLAPVSQPGNGQEFSVFVGDLSAEVTEYMLVVSMGKGRLLPISLWMCNASSRLPMIYPFRVFFFGHFFYMKM